MNTFAVAPAVARSSVRVEGHGWWGGGEWRVESNMLISSQWAVSIDEIALIAVVQCNWLGSVFHCLPCSSAEEGAMERR